MPIIVSDTVTTGDSSSKTYTLGDLILRAMPYCGGEVSGRLRSQLVDFLNDTLGEIFADGKQNFMLGSSAFETVDEYKTGTASFTKGSNIFTLAGGAALDTSHVGRKIIPDGKETAYEITARDSATQGQMKFKFMDDSLAAVKYRIVQDTFNLPSDFDVPRVLDQRFTNLRLHIHTDLPPGFKIGARPFACKFTVDGKIVLYPAPDRILHVAYDYYRQFKPSTDETVYFHIPDKYVMTIIFGSAAKYWAIQAKDAGALSRAQWLQDKYDKGRQQIRRDKFNDPSLLVQFKGYDTVRGMTGGYTDDPFSAKNLLGS